MMSPRILLGFCILAFISLSRVKATCVWNSDFGFTLDCAFKKSSLFRVRNLGGIKTHVGLGFTVGDDLMFPESLGNTDSKRRSVSNRETVLATANTLSQGQTKNVAQAPKKNRLTVRIPSTSTLAPTKATTLVSAPVEETVMKSGRSPSSVRQLALNKVQAPTIPPFKPIPTMPAQPTQENQNALLAAKVAQVNQNAATQRIPSRMGQVPKLNYVSVSPIRVIGHGQNTMTVGQSIGVMNNPEPVRQIPSPSLNNALPKFQAMPASTTKILNQGSDLTRPVGSVQIVSPQAYKGTVSQVPASSGNDKLLVALRKVHEEQSNSFKPIYQQGQANFGPNSQFSYTQIPNYVTKPVRHVDNGLSQNIITGQGSSSIQDTTLYEKILAISKATNISVEAIEAAIKLRQQQLISQMMNSPPSTTSTTTTTTTTTTERPLPPPPPPKRHTKPQEPAQKVMNAPREYYPVGYDKNFDDNFETKVDLPETSFYCGDQKHFPGLYGDEDLGCMVFHVCALTDEGLIMKTFLCPESTLFDQTILKCNWWFYVDCKNTKRLYDSNIPISKSYQLMKALTFFSSYKKETLANDHKSSQVKIEENKEGVNNAIKILHKQSHMELPKVEVVETQSNRSFFSFTDEGTPVDAVEVNSLSTPVDESENHAGEKLDRAEKQVNIHRPTVNRSNSVERKRNVSRYVPKTIISPTSTSFQIVPSTQKSVKISTSQEKRTFSRRPIVSRGVSSKENVTQSSETSGSVSKENHRSRGVSSKENVTKSSEVSGSVSKENHRSERASAEIIDKDEVKLDFKPVLPTVSVQEVTSSSRSQVVTTPGRQSVNEAIAKLDEAIMGTKKPS